MAANISTTMSNWSATAGSNQPDSTDLASTLREDLQAIQAAVATVFPGMAGAAWRKQTKPGDYTLAATDNMSIISCTNASLATITAAAATVGAAFMCIIRNDSSAAGVLVIGTTKYPPGSVVFVTSDGTNISQYATGNGVVAFEDLSTLSDITITGLTATGASRYVLHLKGMVAGASVEPSIRSGVSSIDTGNNYKWARTSVNAGGTASPLGSTADSKIVLAGAVSTIASDIIVDLFVEDGMLRATWQGVGYNGTDYIYLTGSGWYTPSSGTPDRIQIRLASSSWSAGKAILYAVK